MSDWTPVEVWLARAILELADDAGMPDSYWQTDRRVAFAREITGVTERGTHCSTDEEV